MQAAPVLRSSPSCGGQPDAPSPHRPSRQFVDVPKGSFTTKSRSVGLPGRHHHRCHRRSLPAGATVTRPRSLHFSGAGICILKPINRPVLQMSRKHAFYADAVDWAVEVGVTKGTTAKKTFSPNDKCIRAQIVIFPLSLLCSRLRYEAKTDYTVQLSGCTVFLHV